MGTLRVMIKKFRLRRIIPADEHGVHTRFPVLVFVITLMIGTQLPITSCSGGVDLARPYLFRDYGMLASYAPQHTANLYHRQKSSQAQSSAQYSDSGEDEMGGSSEEYDAQYTEPVIVDIDDPEEKARWMGLSDLQESFEEYDEDEYEESLSSREFMSRSSQQPSEKSDKNDGGGSGDGTDPNGESRGIMDNFNFNPFSFWQGDGEDAQSAELPQSDEIPEFSYYPYAYEANPTTDYYYDPSEAQVNEQKEPIVPNLAPVQKSPKPKTKPVSKTKPKPKRKSKPKPKPAGKPKPKKPKPKKPKRPPPPPGMMKPRPKPKPMLKDPAFSQQFHYQEYGKPDKLSIISDKLSKINPFNYLPQIQIQKPQIKIEKHHDAPHPPPHHMMQRPPPMKRKKPKKPPRAKPPPRKPKKKPPPSMMQTMMSKMKPKPKHPKPKHKQPKPKKPMEDEPNPELVMYFGEPFGGPFGSSEIREVEGQDDYRNEGDDDDEEAEDDDDEDDDEDEEEDEEDDADDDDDESDYVPQVGGIKYEEFENGAMSEGEATMVSADQDEDQDQDGDTGANADGEGEAADGEGEAEETTSATLIEDDEGDYEDQVIGLTTGSTSTDDAATRQEDTDQKEKSIKFTKIFGWRKKKRRHPPRKRHPARRPPDWKHYRPAPLLPEIPEGISDTVLRVINKVGFLPEYDKTEKYGGHNKIKGKFTKTRPITLHHGLLTEVLRRR